MQVENNNADGSQREDVYTGGTGSTSITTNSDQSVAEGQNTNMPRIVLFASILFWPLYLVLAIYIDVAWDANLEIYRSTNGAIDIRDITPFVLVEVIIAVLYTSLILAYVLKGSSRQNHHQFLGILAIVLVAFVLIWQFALNAPTANDSAIHSQPLSDAKVLSLIDNCTLVFLTKQGATVDIYSSSSSPSDSGAASSAHYSTFLSEIRKMAPNCGSSMTAVNKDDTGKIRWVSSQQASDLLQQCKINSFNYSWAFNSVTKPTSGTPTGIILQELLNDYPSYDHLFVAQSAEAELLPVARNVQSTCHGPLLVTN